MKTMIRIGALALVGLSIAACSSSMTGEETDDEVVVHADRVAPQQKAVQTACCAGISNQYSDSCGQNTDKGHCNGLTRCTWTCTLQSVKQAP